MIETVKNIILKLSPDLWLYVGVGLVVALFLGGLALSLLTGPEAKFKGAAKKFLKSPDAKTANASAAAMPEKIKRLYKRARATKERASEVLTYDACVLWTHSSSFSSRFVKSLVLGSLLVLGVVYGALSTHAMNSLEAGLGEVVFAVSAVALLLSLLAGVISAVLYKGLVKTHINYVEQMDKIAFGGEPISFGQDIPAMQMDNEVEPEVYDERFKTFEAPTKLNIEVEEESHVETVVEHSVVDEAEQEAKREQEERERREEEARQREARAAALENAKAQAEERRRIMQQQKEAGSQSSVVYSKPAEVVDDGVIYSKPAEEVVEVSPVISQPPPPPPADNTPTDIVIARIEQITKEGASVATMKEVALQLQQERAKPENKTPEQQKRLNEALSALLRAMSAASKK